VRSYSRYLLEAPLTRGSRRTDCAVARILDGAKPEPSLCRFLDTREWHRGQLLDDYFISHRVEYTLGGLAA
jgi:hypothetical protein